MTRLDIKLCLVFLLWCLLAAPARIEATPAPGAEPGPAGLELSLEQAVLLSLENNRSLKIERLNPAIAEAYEARERAAFDPRLSAGYQYSEDKSLQQSRILGKTYDVKNERTVADAGITQALPTGATVGLEFSTTKTVSDLYGDYTYTRAGLSINQSLLRGFGLKPNLASLRQAKLDTFASRYELKGFTQALTADVESAYWDYALALLKMDIYTESLALAERHAADVREMIMVGSLAPIDQAASLAEAAQRKVDLINARAARDQARLSLLRLIGLDREEFLEKEITPLTKPGVPAGELEGLEAHLETALKMRPDLNQARLSLQRNELEIARTKNGVLPRLDLFITLGETGYSDSFNESLEEMNGDRYDALLGVEFEYPLGGREAKAIHHQATFQMSQAEEAVENLAHLVRLEVLDAYLEVKRARELVEAQAALLNFQEQKALAEDEKFRVGKSTSILVAQAQRDLLASRVSEAETIINCLKAFVKLYLAEGSLLERRGISIDDQ